MNQTSSVGNPAAVTIRRNLLVGMASLATYCVICIVSVWYDPSAVDGIVWPFLSAFVLGTLWANKDLSSGPHRWVVAILVTIFVVVVWGYVLMTLGIWFFFAIGGQP